MNKEYKRKNARIKVFFPEGDHKQNIRKATFIFMKNLWKELEWNGYGDTSRSIEEK